MKRILFSLALFSQIAAAGSHLVATDAGALAADLAEKASLLDIAGARAFTQQTFAVRDDGQPLGVLVPGKGVLRGDMEACFAGWSHDGKTLAGLVPTIGFGQFSGEACDDVKGVGVISPPGDSLKIAMIYTVRTLVETSLAAVVLAYDPQTRSLTIDNALTDKVNAAEMDSVPKIRRFFAAHPGSSSTFDSKKYFAKITEWCEEGNLDCNDVVLDSRSKISGESILLHGTTVNVNCPEVCDFGGYNFENKGYRYYFVADKGDSWTLDIFKDGKVIDSVEGTMY